MYSENINIGIKKGYFQISTDGKQINYSVRTNHNWLFGVSQPEETVRAELLVELIETFGYKKENIDFEVPVQQGSGKTFVDIVVYKPKSQEAFAVIECKKDPPAETVEKIRKQARSYAKSEELKTALYYAYRIGDHSLVVFENEKDKEVAKLPYNYTETDIYAYIVEGKPLPPPPPHYRTLKASTPYELKRVFKQCHDIIWNRGEKNAQDAFDEFSKLLFLKMDDEIEREEKHLEHYIFQVQATETQEQLFIRINTAFEKTLQRRKVEKLLKGLNISAYQLFEIVKKLEPISLIGTDNDPKGLAFETFIEHYMKGEFGQYFTPRNIVDFMLEVSPINWSDDVSKNMKVIDPCCGSGSFLVHAISHFKRRYPKKAFWTYFANNSVLGVELNEKISVTAKINIALHDDGHDNIKTADGLNAIKAKIEEGTMDLVLTNPPFGSAVPNVSAKEDSDHEDLSKFFDFEKYTITERRPDAIETIRKGNTKILLNTDNEVVTKKEYFKNIASEEIFFELYYKVLKSGGIAEVVIPDGILTNSSSQDVRDFISERFRILAVISLPQYTFSHYGAGVKSSIVILKKLPYEDTRRLQSAKIKYLESAVQKHEADLTRLEDEKKNFTVSFPDLVDLQTKQADEERATALQLKDKPTSLKTELKQIKDFYNQKSKQVIDSEEFKQWKKAKSDDLNDQIKSLKAHIYELAAFNFKQFEKEWNYPIFMTVAENIGYDATGRDTRKNDLTLIAEELKKFLKAVEDKQDDFFVLTLP